MRERIGVAAVSLLLTWAFFIEYIPPAKRVHLWSDIEGYHYPLLNYAHKSLRQGRIPLWDPSIYCGIPFAGNIQAGLFYPPNWLLFVANANMPEHLRNPERLPEGGTSHVGMRFVTIEILAFLHAWLAFLFAYLWLRERTATWLPAVLGGAVAGFSGYMLSQMNHLGVACGFAWMPFALWGIEQASRSRSWRPLWKTALASAMCLFAGYPPTWLTLVIVVAVYAVALPGRRRLLPLTAGAIGLSLLIAAVQLLPSMEAARMKTPEFSYGGELYGAREILASFLLPNYFDQNRLTDGPDISDGDYFYLGAPALLAVLWILRRGAYPGLLPALAIAAGVLFAAIDPLGLIAPLIARLPVVPDVLRRYNLLAGLPLAGALAAASAVDDMLARTVSRAPGAALRWVWLAGVVAFAAWLLTLWPPGGREFAVGAASVQYSAVAAILLWAGLVLMRAERSRVVAAGLVLIVFVELKAFGTNRRFNANAGDVSRFWRTDARVGGPVLSGLDGAVYHEMLRHPGYRIALETGPHSTDMRHYGLATPQGFDPFLPDQYKAAVERFTPFRTNRLFDIPPAREDMLRFFGVRWVMVRHESESEAALLANPAFRRIPPARSYYAVFEYRHAEPAWRFDGEVAMTRWDAEHRAFRVRAGQSPLFVLKEQFFPGWRASVGGRDVPIERADGTFQAIRVPPGEHTVGFRYAPASLHTGAALSAAGLLALLLFALPAGRGLNRRTWRASAARGRDPGPDESRTTTGTGAAAPDAI